MKIQYNQKNESDIVINFVFYDSKKIKDFIIKKNGYLIEDLENKIAYLYIDEKHANIDGLTKVIDSFASSIKRNYQINTESLTSHFDIYDALRILIMRLDFHSSVLFKKSIDDLKEVKKFKPQISLIINTFDEKHVDNYVKKIKTISNSVKSARFLQSMPENFLNSEQLAHYVAKDLKQIPEIQVTVFTKSNIEHLGMNLLLSVNKGSTHEPRVVILEYNGDPESKQKTVFVGKGITFDTGGVNTKGYHTEGMKYDMSGSVVAAFALKALAKLKAKVNAAAIMCITDNRSAGDASLPENVYQSMSKKWVEVVDTDAEGRLVLADGIFYSASVLKATTIVDIATLTGSLKFALGETYSGVWSTSDEKWEKLKEASLTTFEKIWRMPLHEDYHKENKNSKVADLKNYSSKVPCDHNQAAMFLKEFTKGVDFIHCDIAYTAAKDQVAQGVLIPTLVEFALNLKS
ncbi:M17 family metallopeptidase [Mycoplasmopsis synoviae]|uniref:M17 family metallopeptidase n=1 Tax=Mycoplasmopsis synoviae TaxID=2109 RepID=UPI00356B3B66